MGGHIRQRAIKARFYQSFIIARHCAVVIVIIQLIASILGLLSSIDGSPGVRQGTMYINFE